MTSRTWSDADSPFVIVTPRILRDVTRAISLVPVTQILSSRLISWGNFSSC